MAIVQSVSTPSDSSITYSIDGNGDLCRTAGTNTAHIAQHIASVAYTAGTGSAPSITSVTAAIGSTTITKTYNIASRLSDVNTALSVITNSLPDGDVGIAYYYSCT